MLFFFFADRSTEDHIMIWFVASFALKRKWCTDYCLLFYFFLFSYKHIFLFL